MYQRVPKLGVILIVHAFLEAVMGILYAVVGPMVLNMVTSAGSDDRTVQVFGLRAAIYVVLGVVVVSGAILRLVAGIRCLRYRSRTLAIVAVSASVIPMLTCYCFPTALASGIWGLRVLLHESSVRAFALGDQGLGVEEIRARMQPEQEA